MFSFFEGGRGAGNTQRSQSLVKFGISPHIYKLRLVATVTVMGTPATYCFYFFERFAGEENIDMNTK